MDSFISLILNNVTLDEFNYIFEDMTKIFRFYHYPKPHFITNKDYNQLELRWIYEKNDNLMAWTMGHCLIRFLFIDCMVLMTSIFNRYRLAPYLLHSESSENLFRFGFPQGYYTIGNVALKSSLTEKYIYVANQEKNNRLFLKYCGKLFKRNIDIVKNMNFNSSAYDVHMLYMKYKEIEALSITLNKMNKQTDNALMILNEKILAEIKTNNGCFL